MLVVSQSAKVYSVLYNVTDYYSILYFPTLTIKSVKSKTEKKNPPNPQSFFHVQQKSVNAFYIYIFFLPRTLFRFFGILYSVSIGSFREYP